VRDLLGIATKRVASLRTATVMSLVFIAATVPTLASAQTAVDGRIAFVRDGDIWVMNADGSSQTNLTDTAEIEESQPEWSPGGTRIAFTRRVDPEAGGFGDISVMDADPSTSDATNLTDTPGLNEYQPSWAPSGARLVFVREVAGEAISEQPDIFVMDVDGQDATNLTQSDTSEHFPAWAPDGTKIAFSGVREGGWEVLIMDPSGANEQILTGDGLDAFDEAPEWSPDSSKLVFMKQSQALGCCEPWEVWVVNRDGSGDTNLTNHPADDMGPSWSPDGSEITFSSTRDAVNPGEADIYVMPAPSVLPPPVSTLTTAGVVVTRLTRDRASVEPDWGRGVVKNTVPTITNLLPARDSSTADRTPLIGAKVSDAQTNLQKANITLFRDGMQIARTQFTYDRVTDRLRYTPPIALSLGWHTVRVVARDPQGLVSQKVWSFRIVRP
jgi:Tol biopolymer transport system component